MVVIRIHVWCTVSLHSTTCCRKCEILSAGNPLLLGMTTQEPNSRQLVSKSPVHQMEVRFEDRIIGFLLALGFYLSKHQQSFERSKNDLLLIIFSVLRVLELE